MLTIQFIKNTFNPKTTDRKLNLVMPQVFADHHDSFIEDYLHHLESKVLNKDRLLFGKAKNGYVFPSFMYVRVR